jgi:hypothetical protein
MSSYLYENRFKSRQKPEDDPRPVWLVINTPWFKTTEIDYRYENKEKTWLSKTEQVANRLRKEEKLREERTESLKKLFYYLFEEST